MHWRAYGRLRDAAIAAEERMLNLDLDWLRTRGHTVSAVSLTLWRVRRWVPT
jgi:hypothetical protein